MVRIAMISLALVLIACSGGYGENLLVNAGFDNVEGGMPVGWQVLVMPQEGAEGRIDTTAYLEGKCSVMLRNARPYEREPANNWSQNIVADVRGRELVARGSIRTEDATDAEIWVQFCRKDPWRILDAVSSGTDSPIRATRDWTPVEMKMTAPKETDYVTVRCVLKGTGTAWFDSLAVERAPVVSPPADESKARGAESGSGDAKAAKAQRDMVKSLADVEKELAETNRSLRQTNESLRQQIKALQAELVALRAEASAAPPKPETSEVVPLPNIGGADHAPVDMPKHVPPLIPYGYRLEDSQT